MKQAMKKGLTVVMVPVSYTHLQDETALRRGLLDRLLRIRDPDGTADPVLRREMQSSQDPAARLKMCIRDRIS